MSDQVHVLVLNRAFEKMHQNELKFYSNHIVKVHNLRHLYQLCKMQSEFLKFCYFFCLWWLSGIWYDIVYICLRGIEKCIIFVTIQVTPKLISELGQKSEDCQLISYTSQLY